MKNIMVIASALWFGVLIGQTIGLIGEISIKATEPYTWTAPLNIGIFVAAWWILGYVSRDALDR